MRSLGIHPRALSLDDVKIPINKTRLKIAVSKWHLGLPWTNELTILSHRLCYPAQCWTLQWGCKLCLEITLLKLQPHHPGYLAVNSRIMEISGFEKIYIESIGPFESHFYLTSVTTAEMGRWHLLIMNTFIFRVNRRSGWLDSAYFKESCYFLIIWERTVN